MNVTSLSAPVLDNIIDEWKETRGYVDVYRIKKNRYKNKAIIFIHGGSFTELTAREECYQYFAYVLCEMTGYDIIVPDFTLPPLKQYPYQLEDIIRVYNYFSNSQYFGGYYLIYHFVRYVNKFVHVNDNQTRHITNSFRTE